MSGMMESEFERRTIRRKCARAHGHIKSRSTAGATSCRFDLIAAQAERRAEDGKRSTENACGPDFRMCSSMSGGSMTRRRLAPRTCWRFALGESWRLYWIATGVDILDPAEPATFPYTSARPFLFFLRVPFELGTSV